MTRLTRLAPPPLLALGAAIAFASVACRPLGDVDIYWQLKLGDVILDAGTPFITEPFLAHRDGVPHDPICWLSQVILAFVRRLGDWQAVRVFDAFLFTGGFLALCWPIALRVKDRPRGWVALVAGGVGLFCAVPYTTVRPQTFTLFAWGLLLAVYFSRLRPVSKVLFATLVCLFWQNCHPSIGVPAVILGTAAGVGWLRYLCHRRPNPPWPESAIVIIAAASQLATPAGTAIFPLARANLHMCTEVFPINEWFSIIDPKNMPRDLSGLARHPWSLHGLGVAAATFALGVRHWRRVRWEEAMPAIAAFALCLVYIRFTLLLAPAVIPIWARCLTRPGMEQSPDEPPVESRIGYVRWLIFIVLMSIAAAVPYVVRPPLHGPKPFRFPFASIEELKKHDVSGTVFVFYFWGGLVSDLGYPQWKVSHDGRYYLHTDEVWKAYLADDPASYKALRPVAAILGRRHDRILIEHLRNDPEFRVIHEDDLAVTFLRK